MPIKVTCQCHASFTAKDHLAGKLVKCPKCKQPLAIPALAEVAEPAPLAPMSGFADKADTKEDDNAEIGLTAAPCPSCGQAFPDDKIVCVNCGYSRRLGRKLPSTMEIPLAKPAPKPKAVQTTTVKTKSKKTRKERSFFSVDGGKMLSGLGMMVGAAVWFGLGLMLGRIFFYPPVLFIIGAVTFINGLLTTD